MPDEEGKAGYPACESRYAAITEAGILPRSLMVSPLCRAQERTSALLEEAGPGEPVGIVLRARARARGPAAALFPPGVFPTDFLDLAAGPLSCSTEGGPSAWFADTASVTPYRAPTTRIASSRGSLESKVSFNAVAFRRVETHQKLGVLGRKSNEMSQVATEFTPMMRSKRRRR